MQYEIKALRNNEGPTTFALEAGDVNSAVLQAKALGFMVIRIKPKLSWQKWKKHRKLEFPVVLFSQELLSLLDAGLSLIEALETLSEKEVRAEIKKTLLKIIASLYEGHTLSFALEKSEANFPPLYIETVRASEKTGALSEVMLRYISYQNKIDSVKNQLVSAMIYPALVTIVGGLVMLFLILYVVPRFSQIYVDIGGNIPVMSKLLLSWGLFLSNHGWQVLADTVLLFGILVYTLIRPASKQWIFQKLWQLPTIGARLRLYQLARFYRSLGMLLRGGMPIVQALQMVSGQLQSTLRDKLSQASSCIREGRSISQAMDEYELTTPVALRMLLVGERTGQMGEMMERIAAFYEEETARWLERFIKLFEPLLMTFVGLVIGVIVVLMYFPIFQLAGSVQ